MDDLDAIMANLSGMQAEYVLHLDDRHCILDQVSIHMVSNPVKKPTYRGNVYVEKPQSYRMSAGVEAALASALSTRMLGPSAESGNLVVVARTQEKQVQLRGSLLSMARTKDGTRLSIAIVGTQEPGT